LFVHEKHFQSGNRLGGWWGHDYKTRFAMTYPFDPIPSALGFRLSNPSILSTVPLIASIEIFYSVGMETLRKKSEKLTTYLEILVDLELKDYVEIITTRDQEQRGCQLSLKFYNRESLKELEESLLCKGVLCDVRGSIMRVAPTPLYNKFGEVFEFVKILKGIL